MAVTSTTLASPVDNNSLLFRPASLAGAVPGAGAKIDAEFMRVIEVVGNMVSVRSRGDAGGQAVAHALNAPVRFFLGTDEMSLGAGEMVPAPLEDRDVLSIGGDGILPPIQRDTTFIITKATAAALTLTGPSPLQDGVKLDLVSATGVAHIVTGTGLIEGGAGTKNTLTFPAFVGGVASLQALGGKWIVIGNSGVVLG